MTKYKYKGNLSPVDDQYNFSYRKDFHFTASAKLCFVLLLSLNHLITNHPPILQHNPHQV